MKLFSITILLFLFFMGCSANKGTASSESSSAHTLVLSDTSIVISFEQTACFGTCPVHKMVIRKNGVSSYHGDRNVNKVGDFSTQVSEQQIQDIYLKAEELGFHTLKANYTAAMTDLPTTFITITSATKTHTVSAYGAYPDQLSTFIQYLFSTTQEIDWLPSK